jgi:hypothetical protein
MESMNYFLRDSHEFRTNRPSRYGESAGPCAGASATQDVWHAQRGLTLLIPWWMMPPSSLPSMYMCSDLID